MSSGVPNLRVGDGHTGLTAELDAEVVRAAELLRETYGMDVTIRFNSDRRLGGAWLVTDEVDGIGRNSDIGITVGLRDVASLRAFHEKFHGAGEENFEQRLAREGQDPMNPPARYLVRSVFIDESALNDHELLSHGNPDSRYACIDVATLEEGIDLIVRHANVPGAPEPAPAP